MECADKDHLQDLPLGVQDFTELRQAGMIYVDKTELIYSLVRAKKGYYRFSRPRRFGKSLLLSTFESLFRFGLRDFKGLAIEKLWDELIQLLDWIFLCATFFLPLKNLLRSLTIFFILLFVKAVFQYLLKRMKEFALPCLVVFRLLLNRPKIYNRYCLSTNTTLL